MDTVVALVRRRFLVEWFFLLLVLLTIGAYEFWHQSLPMSWQLLPAFIVPPTLVLFFSQQRHRRSERLRQRQTDELRADEALLQSLFDATPDALLISNEQGVITMANQQVGVVLGYTPEELVGLSIEDLVPTCMRGHHPALRSEFSASPRARRMGYGMAVRALQKDGTECDVEISLSRVQTPQGLLFACALRDISDRIRAREQLRIAAVAFESNQAMFVTDANNTILQVNRALAEATGYTSAELVGLDPKVFSSGRHDKNFYRQMWNSINQTGGWSGEIWDKRKEGDIYPKWLTISAVKDSAGKVSHYVGSQLDITERKQAEETINALAFFDQLTGLPNRTLLMDRLKQALTASVRSRCSCALLFIDLDNFKTLNDTLGHDVGDRLLKQVAQRLTRCGREGDTVARLGGDEFMVVLSGLDANGADAATATEVVAQKMLTTLRQPYQLGDQIHLSTASIGAVVFSGQSSTVDELMKQADLAMYKSKDDGRDSVRFFDADIERAVMKRMAMEVDLRQAVASQQFVLHYQAQVTHDGRVTGAEVLVRWLHPERGMVPPADFIPLAEETRLILPLGHWVMETACRQLASWADNPQLSHLVISVNVSIHQLNQDDFVDQVLEILKQTGANPTRLKLELTESVMVQNVLQIIQKMAALKKSGVVFSLDDFGTGFSSLSYLNRLPLDQLKIDRSFVRDVLTNSNDALIAKSVVALGNSLGLAVIAEGVETQEQCDFLTGSGCLAYQGYFISYPIPVEQFEIFAVTERPHWIGDTTSE